jgi:hypothetical protein
MITTPKKFTNHMSVRVILAPDDVVEVPRIDEFQTVEIPETQPGGFVFSGLVHMGYEYIWGLPPHHACYLSPDMPSSVMLLDMHTGTSVIIDYQW